MTYCRNCGQPLNDDAGGCPSCGCPRGMGIGYCEKCGEKLIPGTIYCARCGAPAARPQEPQAAPRPHKARSRWAAAAFGIVLGAFGVHSFYLGATGKGIAQIAITLAVYGIAALHCFPGLAAVLASGIWGFIEGTLIAVGDIKTDAAGIPLRQWGEN